MLARFDRFPSTTALLLASGAFLTSASALAEPNHRTTKIDVVQKARTRSQRPAKASPYVTAALVDAPVSRAPARGAAVVPSTAGGRQVELEVRDSEPGHAAIIERVAIPISDRAMTKFESWMRGSRYKVEIGREGSDNPDMLSVELRRQPRSDSGTAEISASTVVHIKPSQRVVIARIERSNGSRTEVIATIR